MLIERPLIFTKFNGLKVNPLKPCLLLYFFNKINLMATAYLDFIYDSILIYTHNASTYIKMHKTKFLNMLIHFRCQLSSSVLQISIFFPSFWKNKIRRNSRDKVMEYVNRLAVSRKTKFFLYTCQTKLLDFQRSFSNNFAEMFSRYFPFSCFSCKREFRGSIHRIFKRFRNLN